MRAVLLLVAAALLLSCGHPGARQDDRDRAVIEITNNSWLDARVRVYRNRAMLASAFVASFATERVIVDPSVQAVYFGVDPLGESEWFFDEEIPLYPQTTLVFVIGVQPAFSYWTRR